MNGNCCQPKKVFPARAGMIREDALSNIDFIGVFPARAGMIRPSMKAGMTCTSIPRESGDDPLTGRMGGVCQVYSPRERG